MDSNLSSRSRPTTTCKIPNISHNNMESVGFLFFFPSLPPGSGLKSSQTEIFYRTHTHTPPMMFDQVRSVRRSRSDKVGRLPEDVVVCRDQNGETAFLCDLSLNSCPQLVPWIDGFHYSLGATLKDP